MDSDHTEQRVISCWHGEQTHVDSPLIFWGGNDVDQWRIHTHTLLIQLQTSWHEIHVGHFFRTSWKLQLQISDFWHVLFWLVSNYRNMLLLYASTTFPTQHLVIAGSGDCDPWHSEVGPSHPIRTSVLIHHFQQAFDSQIAAPLSSIIQTNAKKPGTQHQNSSDGCSSFPYMIYIYIYPKSDPSLRWACSTVIYAKLLFMASNSSNSWAFADYSFLECHGSFLGILILSKRD